MKRLFVIIVLILFPITAIADMAEFSKYWNQGKAELSRYSLKQSRYGEIHDGEAVLIFVKEPFLKEKQVKHERGTASDAVSVLKLIFTKRFFTGIYPYTMITSTFSPVDFGKLRTLKVTSSTQEWCGHTYTQLNLRNNRYDALLHSYFQDEADQKAQLSPAWLEDELLNRIRMAPDKLPTGEIKVLPALQFLRLGHMPLKEQTAVVTKTSQGENDVYTLDYQSLKRRVLITFERRFPHAILSIEETAPGGFGKDAPLLTTKAVRTNTLLLDYWNHNSVKGSQYRDQLGLKQK